MDNSSREAEVMDESNGRALVKEEPTEQTELPGDSSGQGEVTGNSIEKAPLANGNPNSGGSEPFVFWRHVPPPTLFFLPRFGPHCFYGGVTPPPYGVFPPLWNGTRCDIWPVDTRQAAVNVQLTPPTYGVNSPTHHIRSFRTESHDSTPMEISPCASPLKQSTNTPTESEAATPAMKAESSTDWTAEVNRNHAVKSLSLGKWTPMPRALKPVKYHDVDPSESSVLSLLKRCKSCTKKMARTKRQGATYAAEECTCAQEFALGKVQGENAESIAKTKTGLEKLGPLSASTKPAAAQQDPAVTGADKSIGSSEPSLASMMCRQSADCISGSAAKLTEETRSLSAFCTERKSTSAESSVHSIPVVERRRAEQNYWHRQRTTPRRAHITDCLGANRSEPFSHYSHRDIPAECIVNRFVEEIRAASEQKSCAGDPRVRVKIAGAYIPGPTVDNLQTTVIDIKMDPLLGACVEHAEGPFLLPSELEEDDKGWLWTFE